MKHIRSLPSVLLTLFLLFAIAIPIHKASAGGKKQHTRGASSWTIVATYPLPEGASGLAWDGTSLYCGIYGANGGRIYEIDTSTGNYTPLFVGTHGDAFGLTFDGQYLWTTDHPGSSSIPAVALQLDWNGNVIDQFDLPDHYMSGIAYDGGDFWVSRYYPDPGHLYRVSSAGVVLHEFDEPDNQPWDLTTQGSNVWIADYWGDTLYCVDSISGVLIESHPSEGVDPAGIVWDGQYLWYCDAGSNFNEDTLYKIDLQGGGTPEIFIANTTHAFGNIVLGDWVVWNVNVQNTGTANLIISDIVLDPLVDLACTTTFPIAIPIGSSTQIPIQYSPLSFGPLDTVANILSDDPINPSVSLSITGYGIYADPTLNIGITSHNYGAVRLHATTRWFIDVTNHGEQQLIINDITSDNAKFFLDPGITFPINLNTLNSMQIGVWFNPSSVASTGGTITINSNDPSRSPAFVSVNGSGIDIEYPIGTQLWQYQIETSWDNSPKAMAPIPDVSGDGQSDVIICSEDYFVRCFNGNAHGLSDVIWEHEIYSGSIYSNKGLDIVQDVNGDGFRDVVVGATGGARLIRMLSGKTGEEIWTYQTNVIGDGGWVYQVDGSRDFTGDTIPDVLACAGDDSSDTGPNRAYCINGFDGSLVWQCPIGGPVFAIIAVDDFTSDGIPDAVAGASDAMETQGRAVGINGYSGLQEWSFNVGGSSVWALAQIGDITNDNVNDIIVGDFSSGQFFGLDASLGTQQYSGGGLGLLTGFQRIDDVNLDGHPDIIPQHFNNFVRIISGSNGSAIWTTPVVDSPTVATSIADISGDGINDIVVGTLFSSNYTYFLNGHNGTILHSANFGTPVDAITSLPDVVGDGSWELIAGGRNGQVTCLSGGLDSFTCGPADINHDGNVNIQDLLAVFDHWNESNSPSDINGDGIVNAGDALIVVGNWGMCD